VFLNKNGSQTICFTIRIGLSNRNLFILDFSVINFLEMEINSAINCKLICSLMYKSKNLVFFLVVKDTQAMNYYRANAHFNSSSLGKTGGVFLIDHLVCLLVLFVPSRNLE